MFRNNDSVCVGIIFKRKFDNYYLKLGGSFMYSLFVITIIVSLLSKVFKHNGSMSKYAMFCVGICFMSFMLTPVFRFVQNIPESLDRGSIDSFDNNTLGKFSYNDLLLEATDDSLRRAVCEVSQKRFDIWVDENNVLFDYNTEETTNVIINSITIDLKEYPKVKNIRELEEYLSDMFLCRCEVLLD